MGCSSKIDGDMKLAYVELDHIPGVKTYPSGRFSDERGAFINFLGVSSDGNVGLNIFENVGVSINTLKGTVRGIHIQKRPFAQQKLVRCLKGSIYDVVLDLRSNSPTYLSWSDIYLTEQDEFALYLPEGVAHGFQSMTDDTIIIYGMTARYDLNSALHINPSDKDLGITWPLTISLMSQADSNGMAVNELMRKSSW